MRDQVQSGCFAHSILGGLQEDSEDASGTDAAFFLRVVAVLSALGILKCLYKIF